MRYHYECPDVYTTMYGETYICDHPVYDRCTLFRIGDKGLAVIQQRFDPRDEGDEMDGDRPVADGRDIFESELQELIRDVYAAAWNEGSHDEWDGHPDDFFPKLHELLVSYYDGETSDVGAQDEASEAREMGNGVQS